MTDLKSQIDLNSTKIYSISRNEFVEYLVCFLQNCFFFILRNTSKAEKIVHLLILRHLYASVLRKVVAKYSGVQMNTTGRYESKLIPCRI